MIINGNPATNRQMWQWIKDKMPELAKEMMLHKGFMKPVSLNDK